MKKFFVFFLVGIVFCGLALPCYAAPSIDQPAVSYVENVTEDITCVTTIYIDDGLSRTSDRRGHVNKEFYYRGDRVAFVVLNATFTYDGTTATAITASGSHSVASGWSYSGQSTWCSGATAYLTATISGPVSIPVSLSLTCSPGGALS